MGNRINIALLRLNEIQIIIPPKLQKAHISYSIQKPDAKLLGATQGEMDGALRADGDKSSYKKD